MDDKRFAAVFRHHKKNISIDIDLPLDISANELILALNEAFQLGMNVQDLSKCHLKADSPIALLRGNKCLQDFGLRNGTIIHFTE